MSRNRCAPEKIVGPENHLSMPSIDKRRFLLGMIGVGALMAFVPSAVSAPPVDFRAAARSIAGNYPEIHDL